MSNPELEKLLAEHTAKVAVMTPEERKDYYRYIKAVQIAHMKANPYTGGERQAQAMRPQPALSIDDIEEVLLNAQDMGVTLREYAEAVHKAMLSATPAPNTAKVSALVEAADKALHHFWHGGNIVGAMIDLRAANLALKVKNDE
jgi:hypothetical protein